MLLGGAVAVALGVPALPAIPDPPRRWLFRQRFIGRVHNPSLLDLARATGPNGTAEEIVAILNDTNEVLEDMNWVKGDRYRK